MVRVIVAGARRVSIFAKRRSVRIAVLAVALPVFAVGLRISWTRSGLELGMLRAEAILLMIALVPFTVACSTWQLKLMTAAAGASVPWWPAARVVTLGALSGLLPISSGQVVRGGALIYWGAGIEAASYAVALDALVWLGVASLYAGVAGMILGIHSLGGLLLALGGIFSVLAVLVGRRTRLSWSQGIALQAGRLAGVMIEAIRLALSFVALSAPIELTRASVLVAASPYASLLFFLPGGLGAREGITAAAAAAVGVSAGVAFIAAALNRVVGLAVLLAWEGFLVLLGSGAVGGLPGNRVPGPAGGGRRGD